MSVATPKVTIATCASELLITYHVADCGRKTAMSALPSPSKSNGSGRSPATPNGKIDTAPLELLSTYQFPSTGRYTAKSVLPSPSKSAFAGTSPELPQDTVLSVPPELGRYRKSGCEAESLSPTKDRSV